MYIFDSFYSYSIIKLIVQSLNRKVVVIKMDKLKEKYLKFLRKCKVSKLDIVVEMQDYDYQKKFFGKEIDTSWW